MHDALILHVILAYCNDSLFSGILFASLSITKMHIRKNESLTRMHICMAKAPSKAICPHKWGQATERAFHMAGHSRVFAVNSKRFGCQITSSDKNVYKL